jgi:hypothetical protein
VVAHAAYQYLTADYSAVESYKVDPQMHADGHIPYSYLARRCYNVASIKRDRADAATVLKRCIAVLTDYGLIQQVNTADAQWIEKYGAHKRATVYLVLDFDGLAKIALQSLVRTA